MSAGLEGGHVHPAAVPEPRVWMTTMTEPKAAQAVATTCGPRQKAEAIDRAIKASSTVLERAARRLTWRKKMMVWAFESSAYGASTKDRRPRHNRIHSISQKLDWCGVGTRPSVFCLLQHGHAACKLWTSSQSLEAPGYTSRRYEDPYLDRHGFRMTV